MLNIRFKGRLIMKRLLTVLCMSLMLLTLMCTGIHAAETTATSGVCGDKLTWSIDENKVEFADGATVKVCLGSRKVLSTEPVISWSAAPANLDRVRFEFPCDDGTSAKGWKEDDGIYFRRYGLVISVK